MYYHYFGVFVLPDFSRLVGMLGRVFAVFPFLFNKYLFISVI